MLLLDRLKAEQLFEYERKIKMAKKRTANNGAVDYILKMLQHEEEGVPPRLVGDFTLKQWISLVLLFYDQYRKKEGIK